MSGRFGPRLFHRTGVPVPPSHRRRPVCNRFLCHHHRYSEPLASISLSHRRNRLRPGRAGHGAAPTVPRTDEGPIGSAQADRVEQCADGLDKRGLWYALR